MLFVPYSTDAPIYHLPIATGVVVVANIAAYFATSFQVLIGNLEPESIEWLMLQFNQINPLQWITNLFIHAGFEHLLVNMFFLFAFGLVIEGKIGGFKFAALYLLLGVVGSAMIQVPLFFLGAGNGVVGTTSIIFGLMVIAALWAPENELDCFYWIFRLAGSVEIRIVVICVTFVFLQLVLIMFRPFSLTAEMLHLFGALMGLAIGFLMLRQDWVDCEGWDIVSRNTFLHDYTFFMSDKQRRRVTQKVATHHDPVAAALALVGTKPTATPVAASSPSSPRSSVATTATQVRSTDPPSVPTESISTKLASTTAALRQRLKGEKGVAAETEKVEPQANDHPEFNRLSFSMRQAVETGNLAMCEQSFSRLDQLQLTSGLSERTLFRYVALLGKQKKWLEAVRPLHLISDRQGVLADEARIRIAQIQISVLHKPKLALETLSMISAAEDQKPELLAKRQQLILAAQKASQ